MSEAVRPQDHLEAVALATEALEETLRGGETNTGLIEQFSDMERSVFMAGQHSTMGVTEGLGTLSGYAGRGHQACLTSGYNEGETFFMSKLETYRSMMEAMAAKPVAEPKQTDTSKRTMSGAKSRI